MRLTLSIPPGIAGPLQALAESSEKTHAEIVRDALAAYFKLPPPDVQHGGKRPGAGRPKAGAQP